METAAHSIPPAPPSPTPLPSATDSHWLTNSHKLTHHLVLHTYKPASSPHPCNKPVSSLPAVTAHCTTSPHHTSQSSAPDGLPLCLNLCKIRSRGCLSWRVQRPDRKSTHLNS